MLKLEAAVDNQLKALCLIWLIKIIERILYRMQNGQKHMILRNDQYLMVRMVNPQKYDSQIYYLFLRLIKISNLNTFLITLFASNQIIYAIIVPKIKFKVQRRIMIPLLVESIGAQTTSFILFGASQIIMPLSFLYANDNKLNTIQTSLIRGIVSMLLNYGIVRYYGMCVDYKYDTNFKNIFKRNIIMVIHGLAITAAQFYLPLPIVHTVNFFAPIFVFIIDYFENGVRISKLQFYFLLCSVFGVLCTINSTLVSKMIDKDFEFKSQFQNYIQLSPLQFSLYGFGLVCVMFLWAYGLLRVRTYYKNNHTYVNFHFGLCLTVASGFLYPLQVQHKTDLYTLFIAVFLVGLPLALAQIGLVAGLALNKNSGQLVILSGIPVLVGYLVAYFRYSQTIEVMEMIGSTFIVIGLTGVIKCGAPPPQQKQANKLTLIGDPSRPPTQMIYRLVRIS